MAELFTTTRWELVKQAASGEGREESLNDLCAAYRPTLLILARYYLKNPADAEDAVQDFLMKLCSAGTLARLDPARGKFRAWLTSALKNHIIDRIRKDHQYQTLPLEMVAEIGEESPLPVDVLKRWALNVLERAETLLRAQYRLNPERFERLRDCCIRGNGSVPEGVPAATWNVWTFRFRERWKGAVREAVAETVADPALIDEELAELRSFLLP